MILYYFALKIIFQSKANGIFLMRMFLTEKGKWEFIPPIVSQPLKFSVSKVSASWRLIQEVEGSGLHSWETVQCVQNKNYIDGTRQLSHPFYCFHTTQTSSNLFLWWFFSTTVWHIFVRTDIKDTNVHFKLEIPQRQCFLFISSIIWREGKVFGWGEWPF